MVFLKLDSYSCFFFFNYFFNFRNVVFFEREHNFQDAEDLEETLYEEVKKLEPDLSGKITGKLSQQQNNNNKIL